MSCQRLINTESDGGSAPSLSGGAAASDERGRQDSSVICLRSESD